MNNLDTERINEYAPYKVEMEAGQYIFETDHNILYGVSFDEDMMPGSLKAIGSISPTIVRKPHLAIRKFAPR